MDQKIVWLQKLSFRKVNELRQSLGQTQTKGMYLNVVLPSFEYPVVFYHEMVMVFYSLLHVEASKD